MSRVVVLGLDNMSVGEFEAMCAMGWSLDGNPAVSGGGVNTIPIPEEAAAQTWLDFGRMVVIQPADLPAYIGVIDTPWSAVSPVTLSVYDPEYLLNLRAADAPVMFTGSVDQILSQILDVANQGNELYLRMGDVAEIDRTYREEMLDARPIWEQVQALGLRSGTEMIFRASRGPDKRWTIRLDIGKQMGMDTGFLLSDGDNGNMKVRSASVRGEIINRMIGISSQSTQQSRLATDPLTEDQSIGRYRMRSRTVQFRDVTDINTLNRNTQNVLDAGSYPYLELSVDVMNDNHAFRHLRPGNRVIAQASKIRLPGGKQGWRGTGRITDMIYQESLDTVQMTLIGDL